MAFTPAADDFDELPAEQAKRWDRYGSWDEDYFPSHVGLELVENRLDYCRMRLAHRPFHHQAAGFVHGGVIATLLDTVCVPAVGSGYSDQRAFSTIELTVQFLAAATDEALVAEGWVERRGNSLVFCRARVATEDGRDIATSSSVFRVARPA